MERLDEDDDITEEEHVSHALQRFAAGGHPRSDSPDGTVPTEYLQQDHDETLELPAHQDQRPGACFLCMAAFPVVTLLAIVALSFGAGLWVLATPAERFSVDDALFTDASNRDCILFRLQRSGELFQHSASAYMQPSPRRALASLAPPADQPRQPSPLSGLNRSATPRLASRRLGSSPRSSSSSSASCSSSHLPRNSVWLVHTARRDGSILEPRALAQVRLVELELTRWAAEGRDGQPHCEEWRPPLPGGLPAGEQQPCECESVDSVVNYLWPAVEEGESAENRSLVFDVRRPAGLTPTDEKCAEPHFDRNETEGVVEWLARRHRTGFFSRQLLADLGLAPPPRGPAKRDLVALRSKLTLRGMNSEDWRDLAGLLARLSQQYPLIRTYYGGGTSLLYGELMASLSHDLWLLLLACALVGGYMRLYFRCARMAALATAQLLLSFPLLYWCVCVLGGVQKLSAFSAASLWVVVGVSADNMFVYCDTWAQSDKLRCRGEPLSLAARLRWTCRQALPPLLAADLTTAFSLLINCSSAIPAVFQFGLCGGVLILINLALALTYLPPLLVLREQGAFGLHREPLPEPQRAAQARRLRDLHACWFASRRAVLCGFAALLLLLAPLALSLQYGFDDTFTFAPDPTMQAVIDRARGGPNGSALFPSDRMMSERRSRALRVKNDQTLAVGFLPPDPPPGPPPPSPPPSPPGAPFFANAPPTLPGTGYAFEEEAREARDKELAAASRPLLAAASCGCDVLFNHCGGKAACLNLATAEECPVEAERVASLRTCDLADVGELCKGQGECGTDEHAANCRYGDEPQIERAVYRRVALPIGMCGLRPDKKLCRGHDRCLEPVSETECPATEAKADALRKCDDGALSVGDLCEADGECMTDFLLNNCLYGDLSQKNRDVYQFKSTPGPSEDERARSSCVHIAPHCSRDGSDKGGPVALDGMLEVDDCPKSADEARSLKKCSDPALQIGERCEADGECGTDVQLNNCLYYMDSFWGALSAFTGDIYRRVEMPASAAALPDDLKGLLAVELPDYHEALLRAGPGAADAGEPVDARAGRTYGVLLGMLCLLDGGLLLQLGHALRTLTPLAIWHPPLGAGGALTALSSLAAAAAGGVAAVLGVLALALPLSLCYFASDAEGLLGHVLGVLLLLHSAALALLCRSLAARGGEPYGILGPSHSMLRHPAASTRGTAAGSLACLGGGIAVLATVGTVFPSGVSGDVGLGWSLSGLRGEALLLALVWHGQSVAVGAAARSAFDGHSSGAVRAQPGLRYPLAALAAALQLGGWGLLLLAGSSSALHAVFGAAGQTVVGDLLAASLLASGVCHALAAAAAGLAAPVWLFQPSDWARRDPQLVKNLHGAVAVGCVAGSVWALRAAHNPPLDLDFAWNGLRPLSAAELQAQVVAVFLGIVWGGGALFCAAVYFVHREERPWFLLRPVEPAGRRRVVFGAAAVALALLAACVLLLTRSTLATAYALGPTGRIGLFLLAPSLLVTGVPLLKLAKAMKANVHLGIFAPWAGEPWPPPGSLGHTVQLVCILGIVAACNSGALISLILACIPDDAELGGGGFDGYALQLSLLTGTDAVLLAAAAMAQASQRPSLCFRPLVASTAHREALADLLVALSGAALAVCLAMLRCSADAEVAGGVSGWPRLTPVAVELSLNVHAVAFAAAAHAMRHCIALGPFQPPRVSTHAAWPAQAAAALAAACCGLALLQPLAEARYWEAAANALAMALLVATALTHLLLTSRIVVWRRGEPNPPRVRWGAVLLANGVAAGVGGCLVRACFLPGAVSLAHSSLVPSTLVLLVSCSGFAALTWLPATATALAWYTGEPCLGITDDEAPSEKDRPSCALLLLLLSLLCSGVGAGLGVAARVVVRFESVPAGEKMPATFLAAAEVCDVFWGVELVEAGEPKARYTLSRGAGRTMLREDQSALVEACAQLNKPWSSDNPNPSHPIERADCVMSDFKEWLLKDKSGAEAEAAFPLEPGEFAPQMHSFLSATPQYREMVGFTGPDFAAVSWLRVRVRAKFDARGTAALRLLADPQLLAHYKQEWEGWFRSLEGVAARGVSSCPKWNMLATEDAFFRGVYSALLWTPLFSMAAVLVFSRSLAVAYAALFCLLGMVASVLGLMRLFSMPLGVVEALALSLIIGLSVDYIIHAAHAYTHSLLPDRFYKSRAALLARLPSVVAAALTTLAAVLPLLLARLLPLRDFGVVFLFVTAVSLVFSAAFLTALMLLGPQDVRGTRGVATSPPRRAVRPPTPDGSGSGWALQVDVGEPVGPHSVPGSPHQAGGGLGEALAPPPSDSRESSGEML